MQQVVNCSELCKALIRSRSAVLPACCQQLQPHPQPVRGDTLVNVIVDAAWVYDYTRLRGWISHKEKVRVYTVLWCQKYNVYLPQQGHIKQCKGVYNLFKTHILPQCVPKLPFSTNFRQNGGGQTQGSPINMPLYRWSSIIIAQRLNRPQLLKLNSLSVHLWPQQHT